MKLEVKFTELTTTLTNKDSIRSDGGEFVLTATNVGGFAKHIFKVKVLDRPGPPVGPLKVSNVTADNCVLTWAPPADDGGAKVEGYIVEKRESSRLVWTNVVSDLKVTQHKVPKLLKGNEYIFRVMAVNKYGTGEALESTPTIADNPYVVPDPPESPEVTAITKDSMVLMWQVPRSDGGSPITSYHIERKDRAGLRWVKCNKRKVKDLQFKATVLVAGHDYEFRVFAENAAGLSVPSVSSPFYKATDGLYKPGPPSNPRILDTSRSSITVAWNKPVYDGGCDITGYIVETCVPTEKMEDEEWAIVTPKECLLATSFTIVNLKEGQDYKIKISAVNSEGIGEAVSVPDTVKAEDRLLAPEIDLDAELRKVISIRACCSLRLFVPIRGRPTPQAKWTKDDGERVDRATIDSTTSYTSLVIENVNRFDSGKYNLTIENSSGSKTVSVQVRVLDTPSAPQNLKITTVTKEAVTLTWEPPANEGGVKVKNYIVEKRESTRKAYTTVNALCHQTTFMVTPLLEGCNYYFRVLAENEYGIDVHGKPLPSIHWVKDEQELGNSLNREIKNTPTRAHISVKEAKLSDGDKVEEPDLDIDPELRKIVTIKAGASLRLFIPIKGRPTPTIRWDKDEAAVKESAQVEVTSSYTSLVIDKMSRNDSGKYTVTAENSSGTKTALIVVRVLDTPSPPTNLMVKEITNQSVTLAWEPPLLDGGSKIKNYVVEKRESTRKTFAAVVTNCHKLSWKVEPLQEGCCYFFRIMAENAHGLGLPAVTDDALKASEVPQAPKSLIVTDQSKTSISLAWERPEYDGGSRVMQYLLEVQLKGQEKWSGVNTFKTMEATVANLNPGQEYLFRVTAINDKGKSDPRVLAGPVMTKDLVFEPDVRPAFSNYSVHVGKDLNVEIPIYGRPKPTVTWSKDGAPLKFTTRVNIVNTATHTKLSIKEAASDDGGMYSINVANAAGKKDATVEIIVLDKPGPPSGPVRFDEVTTQSVTISWNPPKHIGGCQVSNYIIQKRDTTTTTWENVSNNCARTSIKVPRLKTGAEYQFRIIAQNRYGKSHGLDSSCIVEWHEPVTDGGSSVLGYHLERKERNSILWVKINKTLIHETTFKNRTAEPSFDVDVEMRKVLTVKHGTAFTLKVPFKGQPVPMVDWAKEGVDLKVRGTIDVTSSSTSLTIEKSCRFDSGEYSVTIHSPLGKATLPMLVQVLDSPGPPVNVKVLAVTRDSATLAWEPPENDGGDTVKAYHVEKREASKKAWVSVTSNCHALTYKVEDLQEGAVYYFRVIGENEHGLGVPQEAKAGTKITGNI
uniref:Titin n=1 Tax=Cynoglossus semilaevis TaxID=244447 RepID=A0A3P8WEH8_CYNSE